MAVLVALLAIACNPDPPEPLDTAHADDSTPPPDDSSTGDDTGKLQCNEHVTWDSWADGFFRNWCRSCHSSTVKGEDRQGAKPGVDFDTYEGVAAYASLIKYWAVTVPLMPKPDPELVDHIMPPKGGPDDEERALLGLWIDCDLKRK